MRWRTCPHFVDANAGESRDGTGTPGAEGRAPGHRHGRQPASSQVTFNSLLSSSPLARSSVTRYTTYVLIIPVKILVFFIAMVGIEEYKTDVEMRWTLDIKMNWPPRLFFRGTPTSYLTPPA